MDQDSQLRSGLEVTQYSKISEEHQSKMVRSQVIDETGENLSEVHEEQLKSKISRLSLVPEERVDNVLIMMNTVRPWLYMILFAIIGMSIRSAIQTYFAQWGLTQSTTALFAAIPNNFLGCFIMGLYAPSKPTLNAFSPSLSLGIGTALCGCITTWSSWNLSIAQMVTTFTKEKYHLTNLTIAECIATGIIMIVIGQAIAQQGLLWGKELNSMLFSKVNTDEISMNEGKLSFIFVFFLDIAIYIAVGIVWYADGGSIVEDINNKVKDNYNLKVYGAALLIAPLGALLRWQLGIRLNSLSWFPIGTFAANVLGVLLDSFSEGYYLKELKPSHGNTIQYTVIVATNANLTTVSTWINEINGFNEPYKKWIYGIASFAVCQFIAVITFGSIAVF